jgi:hypothetical protein
MYAMDMGSVFSEVGNECLTPFKEAKARLNST